MQSYIIRFWHDGGIGMIALSIDRDACLATEVQKHFRSHNITGVEKWTREELDGAVIAVNDQHFTPGNIRKIVATTREFSLN